MTQVSSLTDGVTPGDYVAATIGYRRVFGRVSQVKEHGVASVVARWPDGSQCCFDVLIRDCWIVRSGETAYRVLGNEGLVLEARVVGIDDWYVTLQVPGDENRMQVSYPTFAAWCYRSRMAGRKVLRSYRARNNAQRRTVRA